MDIAHHHTDTIRSQSHQLLVGRTWHTRYLPTKHEFNYPYRYWGVSLQRLAWSQPPQQKSFKGLAWLGVQWFSCTTTRAIHALVYSDYCDNDTATAHHWLAEIQEQFLQVTASAPTGDILAVVVTRNFGSYFSPVNFYIGYDKQGTPTHLLAQVSNTPWNKRHFYGFLLEGEETTFSHAKDFHVSPFNPIDQYYHWHVKVTHKAEDNVNDIFINIAITDTRGKVFNAGVNLVAEAMSNTNVIHSIKKNPIMNYSSMMRIYWHAMRLYIAKRVPYIGYDQKLQDSKQGR